MIELIKDVSYKALNIAIYTDEVNLDSLHIFRSSQWSSRDGEITIHAAIIGTSHFVQIRKNNGVFTEILSCDADQNLGGKNVYFNALSELKQNDFSFNNNYQFKHEITSIKDESILIDNKWKDLEQKSPLIHMDYAFETMDALPLAETKISIHMEGETVVVYTLHEYQEENKAVWSKSKYSLED